MHQLKLSFIRSKQPDTNKRVAQAKNQIYLTAVCLKPSLNSYEVGKTDKLNQL